MPAFAVLVGLPDGSGNFSGRPVGDLVLRGRGELLRVYEPLPVATFNKPHADDNLAGFQLRRLLNGAKGVRMQLE
jgi:hypothetical protein